MKEANECRMCRWPIVDDDGLVCTGCAGEEHRLRAVRLVVRELATARAELEELKKGPYWASRLDLLNQLATARAELAQHEASDKEWEAESDAHYTRAYKRGAETARALAFEELARKLEASGRCCRGDLSDGMITHSVNCLAGHARALAPLPPSLCVLPREVVEQVKAALQTMLASAYPHPVEHPTMTRAWKVGSDALAALEQGGET